MGSALIHCNELFLCLGGMILAPGADVMGSHRSGMDLIILEVPLVVVKGPGKQLLLVRGS